MLLVMLISAILSNYNSPVASTLVTITQERNCTLLWFIMLIKM